MTTKSEIEPYGVLYKFAPEFDGDDNSDLPAAIRLLEPEFKDIVFRIIGKISFTEIDGQELKMSYDYEILSGKVGKKKKKELEITIGNLLYDILLEQVNLAE